MRDVRGRWRSSLWGMTLLMFGSAPVIAETPAFIGVWASAATCASDEVVEYSAHAYETMFSYCEIDGMSDLGVGGWKIAAQCVYEGQRSPVEITLRLSGDQLNQTITTADGRDQTTDLVRCAE